VSWVKEGRKYGLGAVLVTQQPGSMPPELLSQGDNFFAFHLLSAADLAALKRANAHFSDDLLATLLNEPLVGHGVFWSSAPGTDRHARPYPLPVRVLSFEAELRELRDPRYAGAPLDNYAARLRARFTEALHQAARPFRGVPASLGERVASRHGGRESAFGQDASVQAPVDAELVLPPCGDQGPAGPRRVRAAAGIRPGRPVGTRPGLARPGRSAGGSRGGSLYLGAGCGQARPA